MMGRDAAKVQDEDEHDGDRWKRTRLEERKLFSGKVKADRKMVSEKEEKKN